MRHTLRAYRHRNYRLFFCGQLLSIIGNWVQQVAMSWLVYRAYRIGGLCALIGDYVLWRKLPLLRE